MPISLHSHSGQFCQHGTGSLRSVIERAIERGFISYGLTEHMPRNRLMDLYPEESHMSPTDLLDQFDRFVIEANQLKELYNSELELLIGLETEMIERSVTFELLDNLLETHRPSIDYLVGSVHHVNQIPIDFDLETFNRALCSFKPPRALTSDRCVEPEEEGDDSLRLLCEAYFQAQYDLIDSYRPEVIGHFDLCLLFHPKFDLTQHQSLWNQVERNIRLAISYGALFEVNSASIRKGWSTPYPSKPILSLIISLGGKLTLSDDSHGPERVSENYSESYNYLRDNGVKELWYLTRNNSCKMGQGCDDGDDGSVIGPRRRVRSVTIEGDWWEHPFWDRFTSSLNPLQKK